MRLILIRKYLPVVCLLAASLYANSVLADWSGEQTQNYYSQKFGSFPPLDIDQQLEKSMKTDNQPEPIPSPSPNITSTDFDSRNQPDLNQKQEYSARQSQQMNYLNPGQGRNVSSPGAVPQKKRRSSPKKKRGSGFSAPWDKSGSGFSGPWNNKGSGFSAPWDGSGSNASFPWNNKGSGFNTPWDGNGSGFSAPWNNSGSSFSPRGNRRHR